MREMTIEITSQDGLRLQTYVWAPGDEPKAVVQLQHGLGEHAGRYRRFAEALTGHGYLVYAPDGRGSGRTAAGNYGDFRPDGWPGWVDDLDVVNQRIRTEHPDLPIALFGHSMGSFASQQYLLDHAGAVSAVVLSGTTVAAGLIPVLGADEPADLSSFNAGFQSRTGFEWLSRDEAEVDAYVADEACGWQALGFPGIETLAQTSDPARLAQLPADLPILLISGDRDPLAQGGAAIEAVANAYRDAGLTDVTVQLYPEGRHELLNETNRDEVTAFIVGFLDRSLPA